MGDKLPDGCLISLTDIPPDFEKHLKLVAERVQAMMISVNEYNEGNRTHNGPVFLACLLDALNAIYCDARNTPSPGLDLSNISYIFSEGNGRVVAARGSEDQLKSLIPTSDRNQAHAFLIPRNGVDAIALAESLSRSSSCSFVIADLAIEPNRASTAASMVSSQAK